MPSLSNTNYPRLKDADEFEDLIRDLCALQWGDPDTKRNGRKGQKQHGVDVYGRPVGGRGVYRGAQCKLRSTDAQLSEKEILNEIKAAREFPHQLDKLIIVTDAQRDAHTPKIVDSFNETEINQGGFSIAIWFWEDVTDRIALYPPLMVKFYRDQFSVLSNFPLSYVYPTSPLQVLVDSTVEVEALVESLRFRGIRIINKEKRGSNWLDGILVSTMDEDDNNLQKFGAKLRSLVENSSDDYPIFCLIPTTLAKKISKIAEGLDFKIDKLIILNFENSIHHNAKLIFQAVFEHGYKMRGAIKTADIVIRTQSNNPESSLLDIDWRSRLSITKFPSPLEWQQLFVPAIEDIKHELLSLGDKTQVHLIPMLPIPAAIALGYYFNIREARLGVWARRTGASEMNEQFWRSNSPVHEKLNFEEVWLKPFNNNEKSIILELTSNFPISAAIQSYLENENINADGWVRLPFEINGNVPQNITESQAIEYSNQVGQVIRELNSKGVSDIHLFCRIPSALGVLIGQRLLATGNINLYWFQNPNYKFAFALNR